MRNEDCHENSCDHEGCSVLRNANGNISSAVIELKTSGLYLNDHRSFIGVTERPASDPVGELVA
jgi:predicted nucleic acid-binding Zn ribbon protein